MLNLESHTRTGDPVIVRPLSDGDEATVQAVFDGMSAQSRHDRFLRSVQRLTPGMLTALSDVDQRVHRAAVAWISGEPAGIVRLVSDGTGAHELAVEVVDRHQGAGVGRMLVEAALGHAAGSGIGRVRVLIGGTNWRSAALFRSLGFGLRRDGIDLEGSLVLDAPAHGPGLGGELVAAGRGS